MSKTYSRWMKGHFQDDIKLRSERPFPKSSCPTKYYGICQRRRRNRMRDSALGKGTREKESIDWSHVSVR